MADINASAAQTLADVSQAARVDTRILVWNPTDVGGPASVSTDRQTLTVGAAAGGRGAVGKASGVYQFEIVADRKTSTSAYIGVGLVNASVSGGPGANSDGSRATGYRADGTVWLNGAQVAAGGASWQTPQVVGVVVDYPANQVRFYVNGTLQSALTRNLTNFSGGPVYPMYGSGGGGVSGMTAKISGLAFAFPIAGASEWRSDYLTASAAQVLDGVTQAAAASTIGTVSAAAAQALQGVSQSAAIAARAGATSAQVLDSVSQAATLVTSGADRSLVAAQTLAGVAQAATAVAIAKAAAGQVLDGVVQGAAAATTARAAAAQTLDAASSAATAIAIASVQASQTLAAVAQIASGTVSDTISRLVGAQVLADVLQVARIRHAYVFERNERTVRVIAEDRSARPIPESRRVAIVGERRAAAFTD